MARTAPPITDTARRLEWPMLPRPLRDLVERRCGSPVVAAHTCTRGFTPGFASVLECEDGSRHFVKAASLRAQGMFATAYREEARKLAALPADLPAPGLAWSYDGEWVALGIEYVEGRHPSRPWNRADLDTCLDALELIAERLTPAPADLQLASAAEELAPFLENWQYLRTARPDLPHLEEAVELASRYPAVVVGDTVVHSDVRDDNVLIDAAGHAWFFDWNWPMLGAAWLDSLLMLIGPRGDGVDVQAVIAERVLLREVPSESIDVVIALITAYFLKSADDPVPPTSPRIRDHQRWQGEVCWEWLCERRHWL